MYIIYLGDIMRYKKCCIIFLIALITLNFSIIYATNKNTTMSENFFRIHIVANSDSIDDQLLKYNVAKEVDKYLNNITKDCCSKEESKYIIENNIQEILSLCNEIIKENNSNYSVKAYFGKIQYDEKHFNDTYMDSGIYDSLKIVIENGKGQNWWSLIYPTSFSEINREDIFNEETKYSFGLIELFKEFFDIENRADIRSISLY